MECAQLIKGYGDTHKRGTANHELIVARIIQPVLAGRLPLRAGIDAIASARTAALADPDGDALTRCLAEVEQHAALDIAASEPRAKLAHLDPSSTRAPSGNRLDQSFRRGTQNDSERFSIRTVTPLDGMCIVMRDRE